VVRACWLALPGHRARRLGVDGRKISIGTRTRDVCGASLLGEGVNLFILLLALHFLFLTLF
jgi:hypothetical protein